MVNVPIEEMEMNVPTEKMVWDVPPQRDKIKETIDKADAAIARACSVLNKPRE